MGDLVSNALSLRSATRRPRLEAWDFSSSELDEGARGVRLLNPSVDLSNSCDLDCDYCFIEERGSIGKRRRPNQVCGQRTDQTSQRPLASARTIAQGDEWSEIILVDAGEDDPERLMPDGSVGRASMLAKGIAASVSHANDPPGGLLPEDAKKMRTWALAQIGISSRESTRSKSSAPNK